MFPRAVYNSRICDIINVERLREFVLSRRNDDGGFTFCKQLPSTLPETFYAVYILTSIGDEVPDKEKLVEFLRNSIRTEPYSIFYTLNSLNLLSEKLLDVSDLLFNRLEKITKVVPREFGSEIGTTATYSFDMPNVLKGVYILTSSLRLLGKEIPDEVKDFIMKFRKNGGFGIASPNLQETYYCVSVLGNVIERANSVVSFVREHECQGGGFTKVPNGYPPYLEDTYYAVSCFCVLGYDYASEKTARYISALQNPDGGFRRSIHGGISSLEYTYYAVASLVLPEESIGNLRE
ncbi:prenyltransferase/squalene oxidase repeat-containing protein [Archaeoglobus veneficus]|uniref:Geranylgeranyl transferase type II subunit beta n=1 Tax=Archaeoglobus veneficus (strain DSM 11195 / SNP6) TaxID=693661 RepID=F2KPC1_ARCVS|nr:prenyltransferase/squalene oxidase repeat-containing protein [Archaeoglobus veneficus]AEA47525.1 Prenyltransferase/squalene oxidase [Archaeoglobus veneficus SNP6]